MEAPPLPCPPPKVLLGYKSMSYDCRRRGLFLVHASVTGIHSGSPPAIWCDQFRRPRRRLSRLRSSAHPPPPPAAPQLGSDGRVRGKVYVLLSRCHSPPSPAFNFPPCFFLLSSKEHLVLCFHPPPTDPPPLFSSRTKKTVEEETLKPAFLTSSLHPATPTTINQRGARGHLA